MEAGASAMGFAEAVWRGEWVIVRRLCWIWPQPPADMQVWNPFERWGADKAAPQRQKSSPFSLFKISFQQFVLLGIPPAQLHGCSHNFIQQMAVTFNKISLDYQMNKNAFGTEILLPEKNNLPPNVCFTFYPLVA